MRRWKNIFLSLALIIVLSVSGFIVWAMDTSPILPEAQAALSSDEQVEVITGSLLIFAPQSTPAKTGLIFYPGGRVDYRAYAPYAHQLAANGFLVVIPRMPLNLAVMGVNKAEAVIETYPAIKDWVIGGHSLGGSMAAAYLLEHEDSIHGLLLLASYPAGNTDLTGYQGEVLSISASRDGLTTAEDIEISKKLLPAKARFVVIEGGNHANFAYYGEQKGDNQAQITRSDQQDILLEQSLQLLESFN